MMKLGATCRGAAGLLGLTMLLATVYTAAAFSPEQLEALRHTTCTNVEEVAASVDFSQRDKDPYPTIWYDTKIDYDRKCYVVFPSATDRKTYRLESLTAEEFSARDKTTTFLTHHNACGVCSQLQDLNTYMVKTDLTTPVRRCGLKFWSNKLRCLEEIGFTKECARIWFWNVGNTGKLHARGGCVGVCLAHVLAPNNIPTGTYNPCEPITSTDGADAVDMISAPPQTAGSAAPSAASCGAEAVPTNYVDNEKKGKGKCGNTINGRPACSPSQWQNGPGRLNPCLQCDECRSGPIFQKVAGRTRRNSGIASAISRPGQMLEVKHEYI
uniref:Uncharacterized protein n=1 Tax=Chrysotila carterae TaxID=13221 RepID=A0A7S4B0U0_CHRCT